MITNRRIAGRLVSPTRPALLGVAAASTFSGIEPTFGILTIRPVDVVLVVLATSGVLRALTRRRAHKSSWSEGRALFSCYLLYRAFVGLLLSSSGVFVKELVQALEMVYFGSRLGMVFDNRTDRETFFRAFTIALGAITTYAALKSFADGSYFRFKDLDEASLAPAVLTICTLGGFREAVSAGRRTRPWLLASGVASVLTLLSGARAGWAAVLLAALLLVSLRHRHRTGRDAMVPQEARLRRAGIALVVAPIIFATSMGLSSLLSGNNYLERQIASVKDLPSLLGGTASTDSSLSNDLRRANLSLAWAEIKAHPLLGLGPDNFRSAVTLEAELRGSRAQNVHNDFVQAAADTGVLGFALFLGTFLSLSARYALPTRANWVRRTSYSYGVGLFAYALVANLSVGGGAVNLIPIVIALSLADALARESGRGSTSILISAPASFGSAG